MLFARRGYNVQSLAVGPAEAPGDSRITMVVPGEQGGIDTLLKHCRKLVQVRTQRAQWRDERPPSVRSAPQCVPSPGATP